MKHSQFQSGQFPIPECWIWSFNYCPSISIYLYIYIYQTPFPKSTTKIKKLLNTLWNYSKLYTQYLKLFTWKCNYQFKSHGNRFILFLWHMAKCHIMYFLHYEKFNDLLRNSLENWLTAYLQLILLLKYISNKVTLTSQYSGINY